LTGPSGVFQIEFDAIWKVAGSVQLSLIRVWAVRPKFPIKEIFADMTFFFF
jgi:hypothetical protein